VTKNRRRHHVFSRHWHQPSDHAMVHPQSDFGEWNA
jgi:hypothetical protein